MRKRRKTANGGQAAPLSLLRFSPKCQRPQPLLHKVLTLLITHHEDLRSYFNPVTRIRISSYFLDRILKWTVAYAHSREEKKTCETIMVVEINNSKSSNKTNTINGHNVMSFLQFIFHCFTVYLCFASHYSSFYAKENKCRCSLEARQVPALKFYKNLKKHA